MTEPLAAVRSQPVFATERKDSWWVGPAVTAVVLLAFVGWATYRAFENDHYAVGEYLSPFFSPLLTGFPVPPAFLILWVPAGFRLTCYYYRKAYYRSILLAPPGCAVRGPHKAYRGETRILLLQNVHRYLLYFALLFLVFLWHDAIVAFRFEEGLGVGVGSIVLTLNAAFLTLYTVSCHCLRHLAGGGCNVFVNPASGRPTLRYRLWHAISGLNAKHMQFAWVSLLWVGFSDLYVRMVALGAWTDFRLV